MASRGIVLAVVVLVSIIAAVTALKCYNCAATGTAGQILQCTTAAQANTLIDCPASGPSVCYKTRVMVGSTEQIARGCGRYIGDGSQGLGDNQCQDHSVNGVSTNICNCNTEACNGAAKISGLTTGIAILFALLVAKLM